MVRRVLLFQHMHMHMVASKLAQHVDWLTLNRV